MSTQRSKWLSSGAIALLAFGTTLSAHAADCVAPKELSEVRACEALVQGVDSLRRFVERTKNIYLLDIRSFDAAVQARRIAEAAPNEPAADAVRVAAAK
jgi:hypothetical protein